MSDHRAWCATKATGRVKVLYLFPLCIWPGTSAEGPSEDAMFEPEDKDEPCRSKSVDEVSSISKKEGDASCTHSW